MKLKKIGMRTIKTAFAVAFTIFIAQIFNLNSPFFAGIAAIIAMQSSVSESFQSGKNRMYATIIGAIIALLFSLFAPENPFFIGIGIITIIYICNIFKFKKSIQLSTMVFLSIILNYEEGNRVDYAFYRTLDTFIGLIIGTLINYFILPPNMEETLKKSVYHMNLEFKDLVKAIIWQEEELSLEGLRKDLVDIEEDYNILKKDIKLNVCKTEECLDFEHAFQLFENTYNHLSILCSMGKSPYIDESNKESLERLFGKEIPSQEKQDKDNLNLVYNYHLEKTLEQLSFIDNMLNP